MSHDLRVGWLSASGQEPGSHSPASEKLFPWYREQDSNLSRFAGVSPQAKSRAQSRDLSLSTADVDTWCREQDSNLHALRHWILSPA
ncbi:MAG: hypothetical protein ACLP6G_01505, partial [Terriglobales bacterium]